MPVNLARLADDKIDELVAIGREIASELPNHLLASLYRGRQVSRYDIPAIRKLTDEADQCLARALGFEERLVDLELAYAMLFKGTDDS